MMRRNSASARITSQAVDWPGVLVEAGQNDIEEAEGQLAGKHYLSLNLDDKPYTFEIMERHGFRSVVIPPQSIWFCPANEVVSARLTGPFPYVRMSIDSRHLDRLLGQSPDDKTPVTLRRTYAIASQPIVHLLKALVAEADDGNPAGLAFVEAATAALGRQLVRHAGTARVQSPPARGRLSPAAKRRALELIDAQLDARLSVETLAREVGLSAAHFARAFKETLGRAPHQFLLSLRLERARRMLEMPGAQLSQVALAAGFADQSHLTRLFKRQYGITPGAVQRAHRQRIRYSAPTRNVVASAGTE
jgi:AraC family transcriptional regulator